MSRDELHALLERIAAGAASGEDLARAQAAVRVEERLPADLREGLLVDDVRADAEALLALLAEADLTGSSLARAIAWEAEIDVADAVLAAIGAAPRVPVADAVVDEAGREPALEVPDGWPELAAELTAAVRGAAGEIEVADAVLVALGAGAGWDLGAAVQAEAGEVEIAERVSAALRFGALAPVVAAAHHEAGSVDVVEAVLARLGAAAAPPIAAAVREEAGAVDVVGQVLAATDPAWVSALLDGELDAAAHRIAADRLGVDPSARATMTVFAGLGPMLREAVRAEAGPVALWGGVAPAIGVAEPEAVPGWDGLSFAAAVRAEAGTAEIADAVMARVQRSALAPAPRGDLEPANAPARWWVQAAAVLAAALLVGVLVYRPLGAFAPERALDLQFASAGEVTIEDLSYGDNVMVHVIQAEGDAPLILWVEEEATL